MTVRPSVHNIQLAIVKPLMYTVKQLYGNDSVRPLWWHCHVETKVFASTLRIICCISGTLGSSPCLSHSRMGLVWHEAQACHGTQVLQTLETAGVVNGRQASGQPEGMVNGWQPAGQPLIWPAEEGFGDPEEAGEDDHVDAGHEIRS